MWGDGYQIQLRRTPRGEMPEGELGERKERAQEREAAHESGDEPLAGVDEVGSTGGTEEVLGTDFLR